MKYPEGLSLGRTGISHFAFEHRDGWSSHQHRTISIPLNREQSAAHFDVGATAEPAHPYAPDNCCAGAHTTRQRLADPALPYAQTDTRAIKDLHEARVDALRKAPVAPNFRSQEAYGRDLYIGQFLGLPIERLATEAKSDAVLDPSTRCHFCQPPSRIGIRPVASNGTSRSSKMGAPNVNRHAAIGVQARLDGT